MIYKFKSDATADIVMMGPDGDSVLRLIGKEPAPRGIIEAAAMPAAIAAIEQAIAAEAAAPAAEDKPEEGAAEDEAPVGRGVRLQQRAWPLLEMLRRSQAEDKDIVWGV